jgi:hypothetical protein
MDTPFEAFTVMQIAASRSCAAEQQTLALGRRRQIL